MNTKFKSFLTGLHRVMSKPATACLGKWRVRLRLYHFAGAALAFCMLWAWISERDTGSNYDTRAGAASEERKIKGRKISISGCERIAGGSSFTDEETGEYIFSPVLLHDPVTGYVFLVHDVTGNEGTFRTYYNTRGKEVSYPVKWSDREVRAFRVLLSEG